jgi:hypothetical protein
VRLEGLGILKKIHLIVTRTRDLQACSIVPQPTTLPRTRLFQPLYYIILKHCSVSAVSVYFHYVDLFLLKPRHVSVLQEHLEGGVPH